MSLLEHLTEPWQLDFMRRAIAVALIAAVVTGVIGCYVVLRGMAFIGDAVAHAVFPGVAIAFALGLSLSVGGIVAGITTATLVAVFTQNKRLKEDTVIGVFFAGAFGLGIVVLSLTPGYSGSLESFLFGQILGVSNADVVTTAVVGIILLATLGLLHKELMAVGMDRDGARSMGLNVFALDLLLYALITVAIVASLQAVGNVLVLALLITPAATARLLTDRFTLMVILAPTIGAVAATTGLYLAFWFDLATGGAIVLVATTIFIVTWLVNPRSGLLHQRRSRIA